jgi:hypothetical protein
MTPSFVLSEDTWSISVLSPGTLFRCIIPKRLGSCSDNTLCADSALDLRSPSTTASYSFVLFVHGNSSLDEHQS